MIIIGYNFYLQDLILVGWVHLAWVVRQQDIWAPEGSVEQAAVEMDFVS